VFKSAKKRKTLWKSIENKRIADEAEVKQIEKEKKDAADEAEKLETQKLIRRNTKRKSKLLGFWEMKGFLGVIIRM
jgi:hypothetical protein